MIEYIKGNIAELNPASAVIDCNGMGYFINISLNTYSAIQKLNSVKLYIYEAIREDAYVLYGFADKQERELFLLLISVSGIGGNTARMSQLPTITSGITINRIEVWITNKRGNYENPRNVVAMTDLGENERISNSFWSKSGVNKVPANSANDVYTKMVNDYSNARNIDMVGTTLGAIPQLEGGMGS